jgi:hypothetical protein
VLDQLCWTLTLFQGRLDEGLECGRAARALIEPGDDPLLRLHVAGALGYLEALGGTPRPDLTAEAVALEERVGKRTHWSSPRTFEAEQLLWAGDLPGARVLFADVHEDSVRSSTTAHLPYSLFDLALVSCTAGDLATADALVREGIEAARDAEDAYGVRLLLYPLALVTRGSAAPNRRARTPRDAWRRRARRASGPARFAPAPCSACSPCPRATTWRRRAS